MHDSLHDTAYNHNEFRAVWLNNAVFIDRPHKHAEMEIWDQNNSSFTKGE